MTQPCTTRKTTKAKLKPKVAANKKQRANLEKTTNTKKKRGRSLDSDEDSSNLDDKDSESDDEEPVAKKAKKRSRLQVEVEIVEDDVVPPEEDVEVVNVISVEEVSYNGTNIFNI
jgi:hypothetical protein